MWNTANSIQVVYSYVILTTVVPALMVALLVEILIMSYVISVRVIEIAEYFSQSRRTGSR